MALMKAPRSGVKIRMYRQGHGDCFLLAFPPKTGRRAVYMLIDCGYKPGSQITRNRKKIDIKKVVKDIGEATGKKIDIVVVTHEHQDHVNGLSKFKDFEFGEAWFAWTEDPGDDDANALRERHRDQLLGLLGARNKLAAAPAGDVAAQHAKSRLESFLSLEIGNDAEASDEDVVNAFSAAADPSRSMNKRAMALVKKRAGNRLEFLSPHDDILPVGNAKGVRAFALGPPRDADLLKEEDPKGAKAFPGHGVEAAAVSFFAAARGDNDPDAGAGMPFEPRFGIDKHEAIGPDVADGFFDEHYGGQAMNEGDTEKEAPSNASWRRIDEEWLFAAESFALKLNRGINNTSLVLAFELENSKRVLLFAGDAQLGNWESWNDGTWNDGTREVTAKELLANTVVYKTGHHGSHNATLNGTTADDYANLSWMAHGRFADEFTAFITANREWAINKAEWNHPLPSIKKALIKKASGRVFQTDTDQPAQPADVSDTEWQAFTDPERSVFTDLYFEYTVLDD